MTVIDFLDWREYSCRKNKQDWSADWYKNLKIEVAEMEDADILSLLENRRDELSKIMFDNDPLSNESTMAWSRRSHVEQTINFMQGGFDEYFDIKRDL